MESQKSMGSLFLLGLFSPSSQILVVIHNLKNLLVVRNQVFDLVNVLQTQLLKFLHVTVIALDQEETVFIVNVALNAV